MGLAKNVGAHIISLSSCALAKTVEINVLGTGTHVLNVSSWAREKPSNLPQKT
jgi:hypothetical protein